MRHSTPALCCAAALCSLFMAGAASPQGYSAEEAGRLRREVTLANWDDGGPRSRFAYLNLSQIFPVAVVRRGGPILPLPVEPNPAVGRYVVETRDGRDVTLDEAIASGPFDGFVVVHRGRIVYERYPRMRPEDKHALFSVTKALVGTAVGILEDRGQVRTDRALGEVIRELKGTGWEKVTVKEALEMASGMEGAETSGDPYADPRHKHYQLEASLGWLPKTADMPPSVQREETYAYLATLRQVKAPGSREYTSANTEVLAWLLERVAGKPLAEVLSDEIWSRMGAEADALLAVNRNGIAVAHGGLSSTLRDLARFGLLFTHGTAAGGGGRVVSDRLVDEVVNRPASPASAAQPAGEPRVAYQWDGVTKGGHFFKGGFANQLLYVAPAKGVVIAYFGTNESLSTRPVRLPLRKMVEDLF